MKDYEKEIAVQDERIARRKGALARKMATESKKSGEAPSENAGENAGEKSGLLGERELRRLLKQAQRRRLKLIGDRDRRAKIEKQPQMSADEHG